ncbi:hypothetical protein GQX73_g3255 [Xylaria multiplex]|uniref:Uncharacterized protein n=1 Tax=Xylaria multiplex TaxID=323545 RepID=A0A7C8N7H5_9PEZI|nr:hypothetical protein GQX73_g3255 [Xylaria multiplex]
MLSSAEFQKYVKGMNQQPLDKKPGPKGSGALLPHQRLGPIQSTALQSLNTGNEQEEFDRVRRGVLATQPHASVNNEPLPNKAPPSKCSKELDGPQRFALTSDHQAKISTPKSITDPHQRQNSASIKQARQCESPQKIVVTKTTPRVSNGLAKSRWADTNYNGTPTKRTGRSPVIFSTPAEQRQPTTVHKGDGTPLDQKTDGSVCLASDGKRVSQNGNETAVPSFGPDAPTERRRYTDTLSPRKSNTAQNDGRDRPAYVGNRIWESGVQLVTAGESTLSTKKCTTPTNQAGVLRTRDETFVNPIPDPRGKWPSVSSAADGICQSTLSQGIGLAIRPRKGSSDRVSSPIGQGEPVPQHITDFIETWIRGAHVVETYFLSQGIDYHEDRDVDTEKGVLMEKAIEYPETRRSEELVSRDQLEMTSTLSMKTYAATIARRDPQKKAQRKAEKKARAAAAAAAEINASVEEPPNLNEVQIPCHLRPAVESDMEAITAIYNQEIANGYKVMDTKPVRQDDFQSIYNQCLTEKMPFIVAVKGWYGEIDISQEIIGFSLVTAVSRGIAGSYETLSRCGGKLLVIVKPECRRKKIGTALIDILVTNCTGWYISKGGYRFENYTHNWISTGFGSSPRKWWYLEMDVMIRSGEDEEKTRKGNEFQWIWNFLEAKFDLILKHYDEKCFCDPFGMWTDQQQAPATLQSEEDAQEVEISFYHPHYTMKSSIVITYITVLAASANATVFLGIRTGADGSQSQVAWTNGTPEVCAGAKIVVNSNSNPCGIEFTVDDGNGPFEFVGCGGNGLTLFRDGVFNSNCAYQKRVINCPDGANIEQDWSCF